MDRLESIRKEIDIFNHRILDWLKINYKKTPCKPQQHRGIFRHVFNAAKSFDITPTFKELLRQRLFLVLKAGEYKQGKKISSFKLLRELEILKNVITFATKHKLPEHELYMIFREIISASLWQELQQAGNTLKVSYLGPPTSFSFNAAKIFIGSSIPLVPCKNIHEVIQSIGESKSTLAIIPIENSITGSISEHLDLLEPYQQILAEYVLPINHHLITDCTSIKKIKEVYAHQQSFFQCKIWLDKYLPHVKRISCPSNSKAVKLLTTKNNCAAIGSRECAQYYRKGILRRAIQNHPLNSTRFVVVGHRPKKDWYSLQLKFKTSFQLALSHKPGSLLAILKKLSAFNISKIESRSNPDAPFCYNFYVDVEEYDKHPNLLKITKELRKKISRKYGSYPMNILDQNIIRNG